MRKIWIIEHISLDGVIPPPAHLMMIVTAISNMGEGFDLLPGHRTYDICADYWPKIEDSPMADNLNAAKKIVATHRPEGFLMMILSHASLHLAFHRPLLLAL